MPVSKFIYPRTIAITRAAGQSGIGAVGYSGVEMDKETPVVSAIPASIQAKTTMARVYSGALPSSPPGPIIWRVFIPKNIVAMGVIKDGDIVTDDLNDRYQVEAAYWNSLGWNLACVRLEAR